MNATTGLVGWLLASASMAQQAPADPQLLAQALDRCMATYAVRLTRTPTADDDIFAQAKLGCQPLTDQLNAAIRAQMPPADAAAITAQLESSAKPNFMAMLAKIRSDRALRERP